MTNELIDALHHDVTEAEDYAAELESNLATAIAALKKLHYWFDTDQEIIDRMSPDERANHKLIFDILTKTLASMGAKP